MAIGLVNLVATNTGRIGKMRHQKKSLTNKIKQNLINIITKSYCNQLSLKFNKCICKTKSYTL